MFDGLSHRSFLRKSAANLTACSDTCPAATPAAVDTIVHTFPAAGQLLAFGNSGSSADAEHICGEMVGRFRREPRGLSALALSGNSAKAVGKDDGFKAIFERRIQAVRKDGDVAWGISTSGDSESVVRGLRGAKGSGLEMVGLTGVRVRKVRAVVRCSVGASPVGTPRNQEVHLVTCYIIAGAIEARPFGN
jgi:D-sedoheptulose 7-phosphate isomerase